MALTASGAISLNEMHIEAGGTTGTLATINDTDIRDLISKGAGVSMSFSEWYGATAASPQTITVTEGAAVFLTAAYYGFRTSAGSVSPTTLTIAGNSHNVKAAYRRVTRSGGVNDDTTSAFWMGVYYTAADDRPLSNWFTTLDLDVTGGSVSLPQSTASVFSTGSGSTGYMEWRWFSDDFTAQQLIDFSSLWDGTGTATFTITE